MGDGLLIAILAAGASRRLGRPKQFVEVNSEPLIRRQCRIAIETGIGSVSVVCGYQADACIRQITDLPITILRNEHWREGIASSIRRAAQAAIDSHALALLIVHGDQYRVTSEDLRNLHGAWSRAGAAPACRARCGEYAGPPVILSATLFVELMKLCGDHGARSVLQSLDPGALIDVDMPNAIHDLDLPEHLSAIGR